MEERYYTGIGSRSTPEPMQEIMAELAYKLGKDGWILRSGCAPGADSAFEWGAWQAQLHHDAPRPELYLPWPKFNGRHQDAVRLCAATPEASAIAAEFHPAWDGLWRGARALISRNTHQILGPDVTAPVLSRFVVCWTEGAKGGGGTGQALRIAKHHEVPISDLANETSLKRIIDWLDISTDSVNRKEMAHA